MVSDERNGKVGVHCYVHHLRGMNGLISKAKQFGSRYLFVDRRYWHIIVIVDTFQILLESDKATQKFLVVTGDDLLLVPCSIKVKGGLKETSFSVSFKN